MGCDIHSFIEVNGRLTDTKGLEDRNYRLFSFLAGVRGYQAAVETKHGRIVTHQARGLPEDVSPAVKYESDQWGEDAHSHSYFTLRELLDMDYDMKVTHHANGEHTLFDWLGIELFECMGRMILLGPPDTVRIAFWFDN